MRWGCVVRCGLVAGVACCGVGWCALVCVGGLVCGLVQAAIRLGLHAEAAAVLQELLRSVAARDGASSVEAAEVHHLLAIVYVCRAVP